MKTYRAALMDDLLLEHPFTDDFLDHMTEISDTGFYITYSEVCGWHDGWEHYEVYADQVKKLIELMKANRLELVTLN